MTKIFIASHKTYSFPEDSLYMPIEVGADFRADLKLGGVRDNSGENISKKNKNFCELTAIYWIWKNFKSPEPVGLVHYRRYFRSSTNSTSKFASCLTSTEINRLLARYPVVVPPKRNYFIETVRGQYIHAHHEADIVALEEAIKKLCPGYLSSFNKVMSSTKTHLLNMFVMRREYFDKYCEWLFPLLEDVEKNLDISKYTANDARVFGFLSERMLDIWLEKNSIPYIETPIFNTEPVNWPKKIINFLGRKFLKR